VSNASKAEIYLYLNKETPDNWTLENDLAGNGRVRVEDELHTLTLKGKAISPGTNTGLAATFTISGALAFTNNGSQYAALNVDILGTNTAAAGTDFDQLVVSGSLLNISNATLNINITPAQSNVVGKTFTIATCANDLTGQSFHSATCPPGYSATVECGNQYIRVTFTVQGETDSDSNGLPDSWEILHFGSIGQDPNADPDQDGLTNLQEYQLGTDPNNPADGLPVTIMSPEQGASILW
jgi:hypothetical protein